MNILSKTLLAAAFFLMAATCFVQALIQYRGNQVSGISESSKVTAATEPKALKLNDLVTVHVKQIVNYGNGEGNLEAREIGDTSEQLDYNITARIVDIRPNGRLILEARKTMRVDGEIIESSLTGTVCPEDILPNNTVLSEKLAELQITTQTRGIVSQRQSISDTLVNALDTHISNLISAFNLLACKSY